MANEMSKAILDGALGGVALGGGYMGLKYLISRYLEDRRLGKLKDEVAKELRKQDIQLKGNIFKDVYSKDASFHKKAESDFKNLPLWAAMLTSGALAAGGTVYGLQELMNSKDADTPAFAERYKVQQKRKFLRAAKLLRAVTDDATMRDIDLSKTASVKIGSDATGLLQKVLEAIGVGTELGAEIGREAGSRLAETGKQELRALFNTKITPSLAALGIIGAGGLGVYALRKLLRRQAQGKRIITAQDDAINAWLAQRKETGDANKTLNAFIGRDSSHEKRQLNQILQNYESRYTYPNSDSVFA